jgi:hypothetical protein
MAVQLLSGKTAAAERVFDSRLVSWAGEELPGISVTTPNERGTAKAASQIPAFETTLTLNVEMAVAETDGWAAKLDALCEEVTELIFASLTFHSRISRIAQYTVNFDYKADGEVGFVSAVLSFDVEYVQMYNPRFDDSAIQLERVHAALDEVTGADYEV